MEKICRIENCGHKSITKGLCSCHYRRWRKYGDFDLSKNDNKGQNNHNWKGGISNGKFNPYPNRRILIKNKEIKVKQQNGKCGLCGKRAIEIHHKDGNKTNHTIENLILLCLKCHRTLHRGRKNKSSTTTIWIRRYGMKSKELCKKLRCSYQTLRIWHEKGRINFFLGKEKV